MPTTVYKTSYPYKKRVSKKDNANSLVTVAKAKKIAKQVLRNATEVKRSVSRNDFTMSHSLSAGYDFDYFLLSGLITLGTGQEFRIGQEIKLDHLLMTVLVQCDVGFPLQYEVALMNLPYQATSYTYDQIWAAPTTGSVFNQNGPYTHLINKDFVNRCLGHTVITVDQTNDPNVHSKQVTKKIPINQNFIFQDGEIYSKSGKDWYVVWKATSTAAGAVSTNIGQCVISTQLMYTDI